MEAYTEDRQSPLPSLASNMGGKDPDVVPIRVLCLGNDLLADDALGIVVAERMGERSSGDIDIVATMETGFGLLEYLLDVRRMVVVDTVMSGKAEPGTVYVVKEEDMKEVPGGSPHYIGLFEGLNLGRALHISVPEELVVVAVECGDCRTVGGSMSQSVQDSIPVVLQQVSEIIHSFTEQARKEGG